MWHVIFFLALRGREAFRVLFKWLIDKPDHSSCITPGIYLYTISPPSPTARPLPLRPTCPPGERPSPRPQLTSRGDHELTCLCSSVRVLWPAGGRLALVRGTAWLGCPSTPHHDFHPGAAAPESSLLGWQQGKDCGEEAPTWSAKAAARATWKLQSENGDSPGHWRQH